MKIGILTFHCAHNYGAVLQCYALQEYLKGLGHDVEIIDYRPNYLLTPYKIFKVSKTGNLIHRLKSLVKAFLLLKRRYIRHNNFNNFINRYLILSKEKNCVPDRYDIYFIGSDQVWNPKITKGFDRSYFAEFDFPKKGKYYTYAASFGSPDYLSDIDLEQMSYYFKNFDRISVREIFPKKLSLYSKREIATVLDPTLLVPKNIWEKLSVKPKINGRYVLTYQIFTNEIIRIKAEVIARKINAEIIELVSDVIFRKNEMCKDTASPEEFLGYFKNAAFVLTSSFHGTIFSILNEIPFYYISFGNGLESRTKTLLEKLDLTDRILCLDSDVEYKLIDYSQVDIEKIKIESLNFIDKCLECL